MNSELKHIVIATGNSDKFKEIKAILSDLPISFLDLKGVSLPEEIGETLVENAIDKAEAGVKLTNKVSVADDTGLEVDVLQGSPGVYSARFAGPDGSYEANRTKLLALLNNLPVEQRKARFRCIVAIAGIPEEKTQVFEGKVEGYITQEEKGTYGFGYDSIFFIPKLGKTFAEISPCLKNEISHRTLALLKLKEYLAEKIIDDKEMSC